LGQPASALEIVETIIRVSEFPYLKPLILDEVRNEIRDEFLRAEKARLVLDWQPQHNLEDGLAKTMAWYRDFLNLHPNH
jgi:CDP-glucose 4,6-dehydratase